MSYELEIKNLDQLRKMFKQAPEVCDKYLQAGTKDAGNFILQEMKKQAPQGDTKKLMGTIQLEYKPIQARIYPTRDYANYVEFGTGIFGPKGTPIVPKNKNYLAFKINGKWIRTKSVKGQKPNPFVGRTVENVGENIDIIFRTVLNKIINNI